MTGEATSEYEPTGCADASLESGCGDLTLTDEDLQPTTRRTPISVGFELVER